MSREYTTEEVKDLACRAWSEEDFQQAVINLARLKGWIVAHFRPVRIQRANGQIYYETPVQADGKGFPDLVMVRDRVIYAELKREKGRWRPEQRQWATRLTAAGTEFYGWQPSDWSTIERILSWTGETSLSEERVKVQGLLREGTKNARETNVRTEGVSEGVH